jgi:hypothetical protein
MRRIALILLFVVFALPALAQEIHVNGGAARDAKSGTTSGQWSVSYWEGLGEHAAFSLTYINEGHQPNHYRDGLAPQIWGRVNILDRRLSLLAGIGPYAYFSTDVATIGDVYTDAHGWGLISSLAATWYGASPLLFQVRLNWIEAHRSIDTFSATFGIGYVLDPSPQKGPLKRPTPQSPRQTKNEITLFAGRSVLNSAKSELATALSAEYRRALGTHFDWTVTFLNEGDSRPIGRYGIATQLWAVRSFFKDHLALGVGLGPYFARDKYGDNGEKDTTAAAASLTASYRFLDNWGLRATWTRIVTDYDRDTDVFLGGISFHF